MVFSFKERAKEYFSLTLLIYGCRNQQQRTRRKQLIEVVSLFGDSSDFFCSRRKTRNHSGETVMQVSALTFDISENLPSKQNLTTHMAQTLGCRALICISKWKNYIILARKLQQVCMFSSSLKIKS